MTERKPKSLLDNAMFRRYVESLPTIERHILGVSVDGGEPKYTVVTREENGPVVVSHDSTETNK